MNTNLMSVKEKVDLLVKALDGAETTNQALANCDSAESMMDLLLDEAQRNGLDLTKQDLMKTPPIRDWIWYKNGGALVTVGDGIPRYQQDKNSGNLVYIGGGLVIALLFIFGMAAGF